MTLLPEALLAALGAAAMWSFVRLRRLAAIGAAYKAKVLCTIMFGTRRAVDVRSIEEVSADSYRLMRLFRADVDSQARTVTASLPGFRPRRAVFRDSLGAMLLYEGVQLAARSASPAGDAPRIDRSTGSTEARPPAAESAALSRAVDAAFLESDRNRLRRTRAIVVARGGRIVAERYAPGFDQHTRFPGWSMTKSVLGALVGVLIGEGRLSLEDRALMPEWRGQDPRAAITLADLLRMRSGLAFSEVYDDVRSDVIEMLFHQPDAAAYAASRPLSAQPGTVWSYASGTTNILSAIVRRVVGEAEYPSWPRRALFDPVGMASALMEADASGTFVASSFMLATARDWARFGQLFAQDGVWEGRRVLPEGWVGFSTMPTPQSPEGIYGAHWWLGLQPELGGGTTPAARLPRDTFFALGHEGQVLSVIPSRGLVVVRLGLSIYIDAWNHASFLAELLDVV